MLSKQTLNLFAILFFDFLGMLNIGCCLLFILFYDLYLLRINMFISIGFQITNIPLQYATETRHFVKLYKSKWLLFLEPLHLIYIQRLFIDPSKKYLDSDFPKKLFIWIVVQMLFYTYSYFMIIAKILIYGYPAYTAVCLKLLIFYYLAVYFITISFYSSLKEKRKFLVEWAYPIIMIAGFLLCLPCCVYIDLIKMC